MRIGVNLAYFRPGAVGGSETYVRNVLERLSRTDDIIAYCWEGATDVLRALGVRSIEVVLRGNPSRGRRVWSAATTVPDAIRRTRPELVWSPGNFALPFRVDLPQSATVHDLQHDVIPEAFDAPTRIYRTLAFRSTVRRCRRLLTISEFTRAGLLASYGADPERTTVVHLGAGGVQPPDRRAVAEVRSRFSLPERYFFYPAALWPHKNHDLLLRALALARTRSGLDLRLVLSGATMGREQWLQARVRSQGLGDAVQHLGFLSSSDVRAVMAGAHALVFPSRFEGFGLPPLEAMERSVPVLASSAASIPEVVADAALLASPVSAEDWAAGLVRLATDGVLRADLVARGTRNVARFSWDRCARETREVLLATVRATPTRRER